MPTRAAFLKLLPINYAVPMKEIQAKRQFSSIKDYSCFRKLDFPFKMKNHVTSTGVFHYEEEMALFSPHRNRRINMERKEGELLLKISQRLCVFIEVE